MLLLPTCSLASRARPVSSFKRHCAIIYLEAICPEVPNLLCEERIGIRAYYQPESRILPATEAEIAHEAINILEISEESEGDRMNSVRVVDNAHDFDSEPNKFDEAQPQPPFRHPGPLLCRPHRTYLASVILASIFWQDKCYSNRAWDKLLGLPPREIGRCGCERALGQALGSWMNQWMMFLGR